MKYVIESQARGGEYVRDIRNDGLFRLSCLNNALKFDTISDVLKYVSNWHGQHRYATCGDYEIVKVEQADWVVVGRVA